MNTGADRPEKDRDLELARRIGDALERGRLESAPLDEKDEAFVAALMAWRQGVATTRMEPTADLSNRLWQRIEEETQDQASRMELPNRMERPSQTERPNRPGLPYRSGKPIGAVRPLREDRSSIDPSVRRPPRWAWATLAAALLIGSFIAMLVLRSPSAMLIASADADSVRFTAADGSVVTLRPHSELYLVEESGENVQYRIEGEALFAVTERAEGIFSVEAGEGLVEVLGTRFNVSTWGGATAVYLSEGRIRFSARSTGNDVILEPGQSSRIARSGELLAVISEPPDEHLDWLAGELRFDHRPIRLVAAEIELHFGVDLEIPEPILDETLTGRILLDEPTQSLQDLADVIGGRFVESGPNSYRFESE